MQVSKFQTIKTLKSKLKNYLKNKNIFDIILVGSYLKDKEDPNDIDLIVVFAERGLKIIEELTFQVKESIRGVVGDKEIHIEPIVISNLFKEKIFSFILHEGFSIKNNKYFSELTGFNAFSLFTFSLNNLSKIEKVKFSQALYGRKNNGLLYEEKGKSLGKGSFIVPIQKQELFKEMLDKWKVKYKLHRTLIK